MADRVQAIGYPGRMFARLVLTLLMLAFAVPAPALAACHPAPAPVTTATHHGQHDPAPVEKHVMPDLCIGCVAPATLGSARLAPPPGFAAPSLTDTASTGAPLGHGPPATPPPRSAA